MDIKQAEAFLSGQDWHTSHLGLKRIEELLYRLGNPQKKLKFIHVTGTNGKGSVSAMLESIYRAAGYKTGLFTSPHLERYTERIRVGGEEMPEKAFITLTQLIRRQEKEMNEPITQFELLTALAMVYFYVEKCDIVILEVGIGGRYDATNVIPAPEAAVFTPIGLDHVDQLGHSVEKIAAEKAGIIKKGSEVISSMQLPAVTEVLSTAATFVGDTFTLLPASEVIFQKTDAEGQIFDFGIFHDIRIPLYGTYQIYNAATAIMVTRILRDKGWKVEKKAMYQGLAEVQWPGRFEILHTAPAFILDGAHNPPAVDMLLSTIDTYWPTEKIAVLLGVLGDKSYGKMVDRLIARAWKVVTVTPDSDRALPAGELAAFFKERGFENVTAAASVEEGVNLLLQDAEPEDVLVALGSLYISASVKRCFPLVLVEEEVPGEESEDTEPAEVSAIVLVPEAPLQKTDQQETADEN